MGVCFTAVFEVHNPHVARQFVSICFKPWLHKFKQAYFWQVTLGGGDRTVSAQLVSSEMHGVRRRKARRRGRQNGKSEWRCELLFLLWRKRRCCCCRRRCKVMWCCHWFMGSERIIQTIVLLHFLVKHHCGIWSLVEDAVSAGRTGVQQRLNWPITRKIPGLRSCRLSLV